jgi:hypothetical protein
MDTQRARLFTLNAEDGQLDLDEYLEEDLREFYTDLLNK